MSEKGIHRIPHSEILTYEEFLRLIELAARRGIRKVRVTGGEPLVRNGLCDFIRNISKISGISEITLTTNGVLLEERAEELKNSGVQRVNVSMDTLDPERFQQLTGRDHFHGVWAGIRKAQAVGMTPVKLNTVVIRGWNDREILEFARLTLSDPIHVRFIEFMPLGGPIQWDPELVVPANEILHRIETLGSLSRIDSRATDGPAERYALEGAKGEIGFVSAVSHGFCSSCNRLRITSDGRLRTCLFSDEETDLRAALRKGANDAHLMELMDQAVARKPLVHGLDESPDVPAVARNMWGIGG